MLLFILHKDKINYSTSIYAVAIFSYDVRMILYGLQKIYIYTSGVFIAVLFLFCTIAQILQRSMATFQLFVVVIACGEGFLNTKKTALHYKTKLKRGLYLEINKWEYMGITGLI